MTLTRMIRCGRRRLVPLLAGTAIGLAVASVAAVVAHTRLVAWLDNGWTDFVPYCADVWWGGEYHFVGTLRPEAAASIQRQIPYVTRLHPDDSRLQIRPRTAILDIGLVISVSERTTLRPPGYDYGHDCSVLGDAIMEPGYGMDRGWAPFPQSLVRDYARLLRRFGSRL